MKRSQAWLRSAVVLAGLLACVAQVGRAEEPFSPGWSGSPEPRTQSEFRNDPADFQFAIVADRTGGHRPGVFSLAVDRLELLQPEFVISVGDLIEGYTADTAELDRQWSEFVAMVDRLGMPFFFVPGNHDISHRGDDDAVRQAAGQAWNERFGRTYYDFVYRDVLFLCLNTEQAGQSRLGAEQLAHFESVLAQHPDPRWTVVFMHKPLWKDADLAASGWDRMEEALKGRPYTVFAGHFHTYSHEVRNGRDHYVLATTGGGSELGGAAVGQFDHVVWVTMMDEGPRVANLALAGVLPDDPAGSATDRGMVELTRRAASGDFFGLYPVVVDGPLFKDGSARVGAVNPTSAPLELVLHFHTHPLVKPEAEAVTITVEPGSTLWREVRFVAVEPAAPDRIPPVKVSWRASCRPEGQTPIAAQGTAPLPFVRSAAPLGCPRAARPVTVDGKLDEWDELPHGADPEQIDPDRELWTDAGDCSFRFQTAYDDDYVYVAVDVTDDVLLTDAQRDAWHQDMLGIYLDARPDPDRSWGRAQRSWRDLQVCWFSPGATTEEMVWTQRNASRPDTKAACVKREGGYVAEAAFPIAYLNRMQGEPWKAFRLNLVVADYDVDFAAALTLWWRPDWRSDSTYAGSGTFERQ